MACCGPCLICLQKRIAPASGPWWCCLISTEVIRWIVIIVPIYLSVWRYAELRGFYTIFIGGTNVYVQFWGMVTVFVIAGTLMVYLPIKVMATMYRVKHGLMKGMPWRPSVLVYLVFGALPCLIIILIAAKTEGQKENVMDSVTIVVLQTTVLGLTFTEWMSKVRDEEVTYDLITAMADDFFFAYDVIQFITMSTSEVHIYHSNWCYVCFAFAFVAMFKYLPSQPLNLKGHRAAKLMATGILVSMLCCDLPFVIIRIATIVVYGFQVSDLVHPAKNIALLVFGSAQLYMIWKTSKELPEPGTPTASMKRTTFLHRRISRSSRECWADENGTVWCQRKTKDGSAGEITEHPEAFADEQGNVWFECSGLGNCCQDNPQMSGVQGQGQGQKQSQSNNENSLGKENASYTP